jgi:signal transduction histidine kinase
MGLRGRLLVGLAVMVVLAVASSGWLVLQVARVRLRGSQEKQGRLLGAEILKVLRASIDPRKPLRDPQNLEKLVGSVREMVARGDAQGIDVVDLDGAALAGTPGSDPLLKSTISGPPFVKRHGGALFMYAPLGGELAPPVGAVRIRLGGDDELAAALTPAWLLLVMVAAFDAVAVLFFGVVFVRRVTEPLAQLSQAVRRVAEGDLEAPVKVEHTGDELERLVESFNKMVGSLRERREQVVAQEKLATVGRLAAGVAHEIGNPLAAVLGYVDLLIPDEKDGEKRDMLERIRKETGRIRDIVADLLDYSRPRAEAPDAVVLSEVVEGALSLVKPQPRFRGVTVESRLEPGLPAVSASAPRITQILINLFLNAADAMGGEGKVTVEARVLEGEGVALLVSDSGPGVPEADRERIFDPFFTTKEPGKGTGLGLAVSQSIAHAYGGDLLLARGSGPGATFVLQLKRWRGTEAG